jgi:cytochrome c553
MRDCALKLPPIRSTIGLGCGSTRDLMIAIRVLASVLALAAAAATPASATDAPRGAVSCAICHPVKAGIDTPLQPLSGRKAADTVAAMQDFKADRRAATVMNRIAKGFSDSEVQAIADWWAEQQP